MNYLFKEEPSNYSYDALARDGRTSWTGVRNPVAQKHLRGVKKGDRIFFYHTGSEKSVIGICRAAGDAYVDPKDKDGKLYAVDVEPVKKGERIFFYHTGDEKAVVGICRAAGAPYADPADTSGKLYAVDVEPVRKLKRPVALSAIKADRRFADLPLTRMPRLSVMPVPQDVWDAILKMSDG